MEIYITTVLGLLFLAPCAKNHKKIYMVLTFLTLASIAALRNYQVGADTPMYHVAYQTIGRMSLECALHLRYEGGFVVLCKVLNSFSSNFQALIAVTSIFITASVCRFIYVFSENVVLSVYVYLTLNFFSNYMNIMRQALAISILLWGFGFLIRRERVRFILVVLIASLFHTGSFVALFALLFVRSHRPNLTIWLMCFPVAAILTFGLFQPILHLVIVFFPSYSVYLTNQFSVSNYFGAVLYALEYLFIFLLGAFYYNKVKKEEEPETFSLEGSDLCRTVVYQSHIRRKPSQSELRRTIAYQNLIFYMMAVTVVLSILVIKMNIFNRVMAYFDFITILWIPNTVSKVMEPFDKRVVTGLFMVITFLSFIIIMIYRPQWNGVVPYIPFFINS